MRPVTAEQHCVRRLANAVGSEILYLCLISYTDFGVRHIFMLTGGGAMFLNDAIGNQPYIQTIFNHHDQALVQQTSFFHLLKIFYPLLYPIGSKQIAMMFSRLQAHKQCFVIDLSMKLL